MLIIVAICFLISISTFSRASSEVFKPNKRLDVVSLKKRSFQGTYKHFCTGSILSQQWILTAGHCFKMQSFFPDEINVADVGSPYLFNGTRHRIKEFFIHPNQSESIEIFTNDLCLVKLDQPITCTEKTQPVHLGTIRDQEQVPVVGAGWGRTSQNGALHRWLRYLKMNTMRYDECQRIHAQRKNIVDRKTHICGYAGFGNSLCFGDSGGPLFDARTGYQVGVFSSLEDCSGEFPNLFMKIEPFIGWINDVTKLNIRL